MKPLRAWARARKRYLYAPHGTKRARWRELRAAMKRRLKEGK